MKNIIKNKNLPINILLLNRFLFKLNTKIKLILPKPFQMHHHDEVQVL